MLKLLLYGYASGIRSSRKLESRCAADVNFMFLTGQARPDHKTISEFRRRHLAAFSALFVEILQLCAAAGLVKLGRVALDGTKLKANASRHKAMSYGRMQRREAELEAEVKTILDEAEAVDAAEDALLSMPSGKWNVQTRNRVRVARWTRRRRTGQSETFVTADSRATRLRG